MNKNNKEENKKTIQTTIIKDKEVEKQLTAIDREEKESKAIKEGPFICYIKGNDGIIENFDATSVWRLIFRLGLLLQHKYSGQFEKGIVIKIVRGTTGSDIKSV